MDERGSSMTDGTPLVNIRKSLARMKQEVVTMDVRVGVVQHTLLQANSLQRGPAVGDVYGTGIEILDRFGPVGITEKKLGPLKVNSCC